MGQEIEKVKIINSLQLPPKGERATETEDSWRRWSRKIFNDGAYKEKTVLFEYEIPKETEEYAINVERFFKLCANKDIRKRNLNLNLALIFKRSINIKAVEETIAKQYLYVKNERFEEKIDNPLGAASVRIYADGIMLEDTDRMRWIHCYQVLNGHTEVDNLSFLWKIAQKIEVFLKEDFEINNLRYAFPLLHHYNALQLTVNDKDYRCRSLLYELQENESFKDRIKIEGSRRKGISFANDLFPCLAITDRTAPTVFEKPLNDLVEWFFKQKTKQKTELSTFYDKLFYWERAEKENASFESLIGDAKKRLLKMFGEEFTALIFMYLLRYYVQNPVESMNEDDLLRMLQTDSKSYAEGLWQIIENACKHSAGETAFFGMRVYKADTTSPMNKLQENVTTRTRLWDKYWKNKKIQKNNIFQDKRYAYYLEFYVIDDAIPNEHNGEKRGIVDMINVNQFGYDPSDPATSVKVNDISSIFDLHEDDYGYPDKRMDYYIKHYGMQWLKRHVDKSNGVYEIYSPCACVKSDPFACWYSNTFYKIGTEGAGSDVKKEVFKNSETNWADLYFTEYAILIPLPSQQKSLGMGAVLEYDFSATPIEESEWLSVKEIIGAATDPKESRIDYLVNNLGKRSSYLIRVSEEMNPLDIEILAKAIFRLIFEKSKDEKRLEEKLLFAILFEDQEKKEVQIGEFVRIFSIFYQKLNHNEGESRNRMDNVQIALCAKDADDLNNVEFVLAGNDFAKAYQTASNYVYYNRNSIPYVRLLEYLNEEGAGNENSGSQDVGLKLYPFDLYLFGDGNNETTNSDAE